MQTTEKWRNELKQRLYALSLRGAHLEPKPSYEDSLKYYRDLKNSLDTAYHEGKAEGKSEGITQEKQSIARQMIKDREPLEKILKYTGLRKSDVDQLKT